MRRIYQWCGGRKVFLALFFNVQIWGLFLVYWLGIEAPPDFRWVVAPISASLIGTPFTIAWEDRAKQMAGNLLEGLDDRFKDDER